MGQVDSDVLPDVDSAVTEFESNGGQMTTFSSFGEDQLRHNHHMILHKTATVIVTHPKVFDYLFRCTL